MEMFGDREGGGQFGALAVPLEGLLDGRHRALAHVGHAARLVDAQPSLRDPLRGEQQQPEHEQADEDADRTEPQPRRRERRLRRLGELPQRRRRTRVHRGRRRGVAGGRRRRGAWSAPCDRWSCRRGRGRRTRRRLHHRRSAGRPRGRTPPTRRPASSAEVTVPRAARLAMSVSAVVRLMASTCSPWTAATASSSVAVLPSSLPSDSSTSTLFSAAGVKCWLAVTTAS